MQRLPRRLAWVIGAAAALVLASWIVQDSESFQYCLSGDGDVPGEARYQTLAMVEIPSADDIQCLGAFLDENEPSLVAFATLAVAGFAGTLWGATKKLQGSAERIAKSTEETAQRRSRAYVSATPESMSPFDEDHAPRVRIRIHNGGLTPANEVRHRTSIAALPYPSGADARLPPLSGEFLPLPELFPNAEFFGTDAREAASDPAAMAALRNGTARLHVYGEIEYRDVFGYRRTTQFCHVLRADHDTLAKLTSADSRDIRLNFEIAPMGNKAT